MTLKQEWLIYLALTGIMIARLLWRVFVPGGGWPLSPVHYMSMAFDLATLSGLLVLKSRLEHALASHDQRKQWLKLLFWPGVVAGAGLLLIRLTSKAAWWTGHLTSSL